MQYVPIHEYMTLDDLSNLVGRQNVDTVLNLNDLPRVPNIGKEYNKKINQISGTYGSAVDSIKVNTKQKIKLLNTLANDSDAFEKASLQSESEWAVLSATKSFVNTLRVPKSIILSESAEVIGNGIQVASKIYQDTMNQLKQEKIISADKFNEYDGSPGSKIDRTYYTENKSLQWFKIPWGEVMLYSSLSDSYIDFPVYPEEINDSRSASYTTMPDLLYQYEPWQIYLSSGPRENSYHFHFHRDMWTGDHGDGKANELIRFCQANCFPEYRGSAVYTSTVTLYIAGQPIINGILTRVDTRWSGPLGKRDNFYLDCELTLNIIEVSKEPLNYTVVKNKPLIG